LVATVRVVRLIDRLDLVIVDAICLGARVHLAGGVVGEPDPGVIADRRAVQVVADPLQAKDFIEREQGDGSGCIAIDLVAATEVVEQI
jgi:hypothetical protein